MQIYSVYYNGHIWETMFWTHLGPGLYIAVCVCSKQPHNKGHLSIQTVETLITDTFGEQSFGHYTKIVERLFEHKLLIWDLAFISQLAFLQRWPLRRVSLYNYIIIIRT